MSRSSEQRLSQLRLLLDLYVEQEKFLEQLQEELVQRRVRAEEEMIAIQDGETEDTRKVREALRESLDRDPEMKELVYAELRRTQ